MSGKRFAMVTRRFWPLVGESELMAANLSEAFCNAGHHVTILSSRSFPGWPARFYFRGCEVLRLPEKFPAFRIRSQFEKSVLRYLREHRQQFDGVFFFQSGKPPFDLINRVGNLGLDVIARVESTMLPQTTVSASELEIIKSEFNSIRGRSTWVTSSKIIARQLNSIGIPVNFVADGVRPLSATQEFADSTIVDKKLLAKDSLSRSHPLLRIRPAEKLAVFAGPITASQRLDVWVNCWKRVKRKLPGAKLWIIGEGNYQQQLWEQIIDLNLDNHVIIGGVFDDLSSVFEAADALLVSDERRIEAPFVLQAQQYGLPVLANFDATAQLDSDNQLDGICSTFADNSSDLSEFVVSILQGQTDIGKIMESARLKIEKSHRMDFCAESYLGFVR